MQIWLHDTAWRIMQVTGLDPVTFACYPNVSWLAT
jgi:hypothetical protein